MAILWRLLVTVGCLAAGYTAVLMSRCRSLSFASPLDDPVFWSCSETGSGVSGQGVSAGVLTVIVLALVVVWLPPVRRWRSHRLRVRSSLGENLQRATEHTSDVQAGVELPDLDNGAIREAALKAMEGKRSQHSTRWTKTTVPTMSPAPEPTVDISATSDLPATATNTDDTRSEIDDLRARVDAVEESLVSESLSPREAMSQWIQLLKDCNDALNSGSIPGPVFRELNTRLLGLFTLPSESDTSARALVD